MLDFILRPWHLIVLFMASQLNHEQQRVIEYLRTENQVLREKLGKKQLRKPKAQFLHAFVVVMAVLHLLVEVW